MTKTEIRRLVPALLDITEKGVRRPGGPGTFVRLFQTRFAEAVRSGVKRQTIRPLPRRLPMVGDILSLRTWTGKPYRSKQQILRIGTIQSVKICCITHEGIARQSPDGCLLQTIGVRAIFDHGEWADRFARDDGFADFSEMRSWFVKEHGLPFDGLIITWTL